MHEQSKGNGFELCHSDAVRTEEYRRLCALQMLTDALLQCTGEHEYGSARFKQILAEAMFALELAKKADRSTDVQRLAVKLRQV